MMKELIENQRKYIIAKLIADGAKGEDIIKLTELTYKLVELDIKEALTKQ